MTIFAFVLGIVFVAAGFGGIIASIDLLPTELGLLYAGCGVLAICAGGVTFAIGALIYRLGTLGAMLERAQIREAWPTAAPSLARDVAGHDTQGAESQAPDPEALDNDAPPFDEAAPLGFEHAPPIEGASQDEPPLEDEEAVNENRVGHLPTMAAIEHALAEPEAAPTLVGHYSAGGANYMIFSDGSIEAETEEGAFKFASMGEFKAYLAGPRA